MDAPIVQLGVRADSPALPARPNNGRCGGGLIYLSFWREPGLAGSAVGRPVMVRS